MAYLSSVEANEIIRSSLDASNLVDFGNGLRNCDLSILESNADSMILQLSHFIKKELSTLSLHAVSCIIKELLKRLSSSSIPVPPSLTKLMTVIFQHQTSSAECQAIALQCLSSIVSVYPSSAKTHFQNILEWSKRSLYSGHTQLIQESALLIVTLHSSSKRPGDFSELFSSSLELLRFLIELLTGEEASATSPSFYLSPTLPLEGQDRLSCVVNAIRGITRVLCYSLALETSVSHVTVPLHQAMDIVWLAIDCRVTAPSLGVLVRQVSWQFLLSLIQSCKAHLLPYSEIIEAGIVRTLQNNPPPVITALVCECSNKWIEVRGHGYLFVENLVTNLSLVGHRLMKDIVQNASNSRVYHRGSDICLLRHCLETLCICLEDSHLDLPPKLLKAVDMLGGQASRCCCLSSKHTVSANKLITVTRELTRAVIVDLREEVMHKETDSMTAETIPVTNSWTAEQTTVRNMLGRQPQLTKTPPTPISENTSSSSSVTPLSMQPNSNKEVIPLKQGMKKKSGTLLSKRLPCSTSVEDSVENSSKKSKTLNYVDISATVQKVSTVDDAGEDEEVEVVDVTEEDLLMEIFQK